MGGGGGSAQGTEGCRAFVQLTRDALGSGPAGDRVILLAAVVAVKESLHPLQKFEVVLVLALDELVDVDRLVDLEQSSTDTGGVDGHSPQ